MTRAVSLLQKMSIVHYKKNPGKHITVNSVMKTSRLFTILFLLFATSGIFAQQNHFIYIQTENSQAFYVKLDQKVFSSSNAGYVIIPKLADGSYDFSVGFPRNAWPEQKVTIKVDKKDAGFMLKNFGEKGWGLFNLQTLELSMASGKSTQPGTQVTEKKGDDFTSVLSNVVNDPSIRQPAAAEEPKKTTSTDAETPVNSGTVAQKEAVKKNIESIVVKLAKNEVEGGTEFTYLDKSGDQADTVRIFLSADVPVKTAPEKPIDVNATVTEQPVITKTAEPINKPVEAVTPQQKTENGKFIDMELPNPNSTGKPVTTDTVIITTKKIQDSSGIVKQAEPVKKPPVIANTDCRNFATQDDFLKLRKKMAAENGDDDMVAAARKVFKTKCFTTEQVKNLAVLFLKDEGRYKFFDAAYPFVSDSYNFPELEHQLSDEYFITRFKAMVRH